MATTITNSFFQNGQFCPICLDKFTSPRQLPCLHSFCEHCLRDYITTIARSTEKASNDFMCPVCSAVTKPANRDKPVGEWASLFPNNPFLVGKVDRFCEVCLNSSSKSTTRAKKFCVVCEECLCDVCAVCHQNMKISKGHQIITIEEFDNDPENRIKRKRLSEGFGCLEHDNDNIKFYCRSHEIACCATCSFLHHKACQDVFELQHNIPCLLKEMNAQKISKQLDELKGKLKKFVEINKEIIGILRSQVNNIPTEIRDLRKKVNDVLDKTEKMAKLDGNRIYEEWLIRKQEQNHQCQSLAIAIGNSQALLNTVSQYGSDTQKFLVTSKTTKLLHWYTDQVREKSERLDNIRIKLELDKKINAVLSKDDIGLVKIECQEEVKDLQCISLMIPLQKRTVELSKIIDLKCPGKEEPMYVGMVHLSDGYLLLADHKNKTCCMYDSSYNLITSYILNGQPNDMCLIGNNQVAMTIPVKKTVQILSIRDLCIIDAHTVLTKYTPLGVDTVSPEEILVSGHCGAGWGSSKCYWSLINSRGDVKLHHYFYTTLPTDCVYTALNSSKSRVYLSVGRTDEVYCFGLRDGTKYFVYSSSYLKSPKGVAVDREDNVYVLGGDSRNIHKLSPDCVKLQVITSRDLLNPRAISFNQSRDSFLVANGECTSRELLYFVHNHIS